jgi:cell wall-associated NlpC family hydrolase
MSEQDLASAATRVVDQLSGELFARYGWTSLAVRCEGFAAERRLVARGTAPTARAKEQLAARLGELLAPGWTLDPSGISESRTGHHRALAQTTRLWRALPRHGSNALATELEPEDGPVEVLASVGNALLVRGVDATVGWTEHPLGGPAAPARIAPARSGVERLLGELEGWIGAPYLLGGTLTSGVDCSGLAQRCFRRALGVVLPRHSADQLAFANSAAPRGAQRGDLVFVWTQREGRCHVGVASGASSVIHASVSRQRVLEDSLADFTRGAERLELAPYQALVQKHHEFVGRASIELPEREP